MEKNSKKCALLTLRRRFLHAIERALLRLRLDHSIKAVEVCQRKNRNDICAIALGYDSPRLRRQMAENKQDIAREHALQTRLHTRLTEIGA